MSSETLTCRTTIFSQMSVHLKGQDGLAQNITDRLINQKFPSAILIDGPVGVGKAILALNLAACLLDPYAPHPEHHLLLSEAHPDARLIKPDASKTKPHISIDSVREALRFMQQTPTRAACKVCLIRDAEHLNSNASNALLKALEEPRPYSYFILTSAHSAALLPTILSRVVRFRAKALKSDSMEAVIKENHWPHDRVLIKMAAGRPGLYHKLLEHNDQSVLGTFSNWSVPSQERSNVVSFCVQLPEVALEALQRFGLQHIQEKRLDVDMLDALLALPSRYKALNTINIDPKALWNLLLDEAGIKQV